LPTSYQDFKVRVSEKGAEKTARALRRVDSSTQNLVKTIMSYGAAYFSARGMYSALTSSIKLYAEQARQEDLLRKRVGMSADALIQQAAAMQQNSIYGDEVIIRVMRLVRDLGAKTPQAIQKATQASMELASTLDMDLASAARLVGQAMSGNVATLARYLPEVRKLTKAEAEQGKAIDLIIQKFGGSAKAEAGTFYGSLQQTKNALGDFAEVLGKQFVPALKSANGVVKDAITFWSKWFDRIGLGKRDISAGLAVLPTVPESEIGKVKREYYEQQKKLAEVAAKAKADVIKKHNKPGGKLPEVKGTIAYGGVVQDWQFEAAQRMDAEKRLADYTAQQQQLAAKQATEAWFRSTQDRLDTEANALAKQAEMYKAAIAWQESFGSQWQSLAQGFTDTWAQVWGQIVLQEKTAGKQILAGILGRLGDWAMSEGWVMFLSALANAYTSGGVSLAGIGPSLALIAAGGVLKAGQALTGGYRGVAMTSGTTLGGGFPQGGGNRKVVNVYLYSLEPQDPAEFGKRLKDYQQAADAAGF